MRIKVDFEGIASTTIHLQNAIRPDSELKQYANMNLARYCEKYVPASSAKLLAQPVAITDEYVQFRGPYGHYQYMGVVYGPNIPIWENGTITGFFSIPKKPKTKTDRELNYSQDINPKAQSHWDRAAMVEHLGDLEDDIRKFIRERYEDD